MARARKLRGDGSYREIGTDKDGKPVYEVTISTGWNPLKRRYEKRTRRAHGTMADVMRVRDELKAEAAAGVLRDADKETFYEFANEWLRLRRADEALSTATADQIEYALKVLFDYMGPWKLKEITAPRVDAVYGRIRDERGLSSSTMRQIHVTLGLVMKKALEYGYVTRNPLDGVQKPRAASGNRRSLDFAEVVRLRGKVDEKWGEELSRYRAKELRRKGGNRKSVYDLRPLSFLMAVRLMMATGMRRGEALALKWGQVDLAEGSESITVTSTLTQKMELRKAKTRSGVRSIAIDGDTAAILREWKEIQRSALGSMLMVQGAHTPVCTSSTGGNVKPDGLSTWWRSLRDTMGFHNLTLHELRHTHATLLLASGVDIKTVSTRLGHSSAAITIDMYAHAMPETDRGAALMMGSILSDAEEGEQLLKTG